MYMAYNSQEKMSSLSNHWGICVEEETCGGIREVSLFTKNLSERKIFLTGEITEDLANKFVMQMMYLVSASSDPINIYLNSPGGTVDAGLVIYDIIQSCDGKVPVNIYCIGMAASMGAVILASGQKGRRFVLPHSRIMIHEVRIDGGLSGTVTSIKKAAESMEQTNAIAAEILAKHTGKSLEEIYEATSFDNYMTPEEAKTFGLCDEVGYLF